MGAKGISIIVLVLLAIGPLSLAFETPDHDPSNTTMVADEPIETAVPPADLEEMLAGLEDYFIENRGQVANEEVLYYAHGDPLSIGLTRNGVLFILLEDTDRPVNGPLALSTSPREGYTFGMRFVDSTLVTPVGMDNLVTSHNFFLGNEPDAWLRNIRSYSSVYYEDIYHGIDLKFYFRDGLFKYDLILEEWADPEQIVVEFEGIVGLSIDPLSNDLLIETPIGTIRDTAPIFLEGQDGLGHPTVGEYHLSSTNSYSFQVPDTVNTENGFIIDPGLEYSTYLGGDQDYDFGYDVDVDDEGNVYATGQTHSKDFPPAGHVIQGKGDIFVVRLDPTLSTILNFTIIGGNEGEAEVEQPINIEYDENFGIFLIGVTRSNEFPTTNDALFREQQGMVDIFLVKLSFQLDLLYSTYIGGNDQDQVRDLEIMEDGSLYIGGVSASWDFPTTPGAYCETREHDRIDYDFVIMKISSSLDEIEYSTFVGYSGQEMPISIEIDTDGTVYVAGATSSQNFYTTPGTYSPNWSGGEYDDVLFTMDPTLSSILRSTFIGSDGDEGFCDMKLGPDSNVYYIYSTDSATFPLTPDAFDVTYSGMSESGIAILNGTMTELLFSSYIGGDGTDKFYAAEYRPSDHLLYLSGYTTSYDPGATKGAFDSILNGGNDCLFGVINLNNNSLEYLTVFGGDEVDYTYIRGLAVKSDGKAVMTGVTTSKDLPVTDGVLKTSSPNASRSDAFVCILDPSPVPVLPAPVLEVSPHDDHVNLTMELDVDWCAILGYGIWRGDSPDEIDEFLGFSRTPTYTDDTVENGRIYYYQVVANNTAGESPRSNWVEVRPLGIPSSPVVVGWSGDGTVHLNWTPPAYKGEGEIIGYLVYNTTSANRTDFILLAEVGNVTSWNHVEVEVGDIQLYRVVARNDVHEGIASEPIEVLVNEPPWEPTSFEVEGDVGHVAISWGPPDSDGGSTLLGYHILRGTSTDDLNFLAYTLPNTIAYIDSDVIGGIEYHYQMMAFSSVGIGPPTSILQAMPLGPPASPSDISADSGDGTVVLTWGPPENNGGAAITGYHVHMGPTEDGPWQKEWCETTQYHDLGLVNGEPSYYMVSATNMHGEGEPSLPIRCTPYGLPNAPGDVSAEWSPGEVTLTWNAPSITGGADIMEFHVYRWTETTEPTIISTMGADTTHFIDTNFKNGTAYSYAVSASTIAGEGDISEPASVRPSGPPGRPVGLMATIGEHLIELSWEEPDDDGGQPVVGYNVYRGDSEDDLVLLASSMTGTTYADGNVTMGLTYMYAVSAINAVGESEMASVSKTLLSVPSEPKDVSVKRVDGSVVITWNMPESIGGLPLTGYIIMRGIEEGALGRIDTLGLEYKYTDTSEIEGDGFFYSVVAVNGKGEGQPSEPVFIAPSGPSEGEDELSWWVMMVVIVLFAIVLIGGILLVMRRGPPTRGEPTQARSSHLDDRETSGDGRGVRDDD